MLGPKYISSASQLIMKSFIKQQPVGIGAQTEPQKFYPLLISFTYQGHYPGLSL